MAIRDSFLPEFDLEMANTRKTLERVPGEKFSWRPHEKSYTMQQLASHVANIPSWICATLEQDSVDADSASTPHAESTASLLQKFDDNVTKARKSLQAASDEVLQKNWALRYKGEEVFSLPRTAVLRSFVMNHMIHHRAQLGVYLRLNDIPVPSTYGPSADESA